MNKTMYPTAARYPPELSLLSPEELLPLALLSPEMRQRLLADMQELVRIEREFIVAQQLISQLDLYALSLTYHTLATADLLQSMGGWSAELEEFDRQRRQQYVQTMHELVALAHAQVLRYLKGE